MPTVFRRAHDLVASGACRYSCDAIHTAAGDGRAYVSRCPRAAFFWREHFTPADDSPELYWLVGTGLSEVEKHEWRLTALLLAAEMAKDSE